MKISILLTAALLALAACNQSNPPVLSESAAPSGGSAGAQGEANCETVPTNPDDMEQWNQLCQAGGRS